MRFISSQLLRAAWLCCAVILAVSVTACKDDNKISTELSVSTQTVSAPEGGVTSSIAVTSNVAWTISDNGDKSWYSYNPATGKEGQTTVSVTVQANKTLSVRTVKLTITAAEKTAEVTISQDAMGARMTVTPTELDYAKTAGKDTVIVNTNLTWTIAVDAAATWCTLSVAGGTANDSIVSVNVTANDIASERSATLTVKATGTADRFVTISQEAASTLSLSAASLTVDYKNRPISQANTTIDVTSNTDWEITKPSASTFSYTNITEGSGDADFNVLFNEINFSRNDQATTYTVATADGAVSKKLYVKRLAEVGATTFTETWATATHGDSIFTVGNWWGNADNNMAWTVFSDVSKQYIVADVNKGVADQPYELWMISPALDLDNATTKSAAFHSLVKYALTTSSAEVFLLDTKEGTPSTATKLSAITATAMLQGDSDWIASGDIDLSGFSGIKYIGIRYKALGGGQTGGTARTATAFYVDNFTFGVPAIDILRVSPANINKTADASTTTVTLYASKNWTATISPASASSWCSLSAATGTVGNRTFNVLITENEEFSTRAATVTISMTGSTTTQNIAITQESAAPVLAKWSMSAVRNNSGGIAASDTVYSTDSKRHSITRYTNPISSTSGNPVSRITAIGANSNITMTTWYHNDYILFKVNTTDNASKKIGFQCNKVLGSAYATSPRDWTVEWIADTTGMSSGTVAWNRNSVGTNDFQLTASGSTATESIVSVQLENVTPINNTFFIRLRVASNIKLNGLTQTTGDGKMNGGIIFRDNIIIDPVVAP